MDYKIFLSCFVGYVLVMIFIGWLVSRKNKSGEDFLLGGRDLPIFLTLGTTVATMVGTGSSMGAVGFAYANGWAGTLYGIGGAIGILLLAAIYAPVRELRFMTMSEELSYYVGASRLVQDVVAVLILLASIGWLGAHIIGGGLYLSWVTGLDPALAKLCIALGFVIYVIIGGYTAVVWTDTIQAVILFFGFILMAYLSTQFVGGWDAIISAQPEANTTFLAVGKIGIIPAISLALVILVGILATPSYRQRIYSGKNVAAVRKSFYMAGILYLGFSAIPAIIGMAALAINGNMDNSFYAFLYVAVEVLPFGVGIVVLIAGLSATMSSASSDAITSVTILLRDIYIMVFRKMPEPTRAIFLSRIGLVLIVGVALVFALSSDNIIIYITTMISTVLSGMCACMLLGHFWDRFNWQGALGSLAGGSITAIVVLFQDNWLAYWGNPVIPSLSMALVSGTLISLVSPKSARSKEEALEILTAERNKMESVSPKGVGKLTIATEAYNPNVSY